MFSILMSEMMQKAWCGIGDALLFSKGIRSSFMRRAIEFENAM